MFRVEGPDFKDQFGRTLTLRGINLSGSSKVPTRPDGATHRTEGFFEHRQVSFVGRPMPLEEIDEHYRRLQAWGFNLIRYLVTWEAIEHAGPGLYDEEYLEFTRAVVKRAGDYGLFVVIDPHQDVWSRFTGGDGAPGWTLELAGMEIANLHPAGAAIVHQVHGDPFPRMIWPTSAFKLAASTLFSLFFAGNDFAPSFQVEGKSIQEFLQDHYVRAYQQLALRLKDLPHVCGYGNMNEPHSGYIGCQDLTSVTTPVKIGATPTPFQSILLGSGYPQMVEHYELRMNGPRRTGIRQVNPAGVSIWRSPQGCPWRREGIWDVDPSGKPRLLRPDHFARVGEKVVNFNQDYLKPFTIKMKAAMEEVHPGTLMFLESEAGHRPPRVTGKEAVHLVYSPHWYDPISLMLKQFTPWIGFDLGKMKLVFGAARIRKTYAAQLNTFKKDGSEQLENSPALLGEFGTPFDMHHKQAFQSGDFSAQRLAMDRGYQAVEDSLISSALWNYTPDNSNDRGDQWNGEDFSIFSRDQQTNPADLNSGGRALEACVRPYPRSTAGMPVEYGFDLRLRRFHFRYQSGQDIDLPSEIFVPAIHYPKGLQVSISAGRYEHDPGNQRLLHWAAEPNTIHTMMISPKQ